MDAKKGLTIGILIPVVTMVLMFVGQWAFGFMNAWLAMGILFASAIAGVFIAIKTGN
jgi:hypothetical protein